MRQSLREYKLKTIEQMMDVNEILAYGGATVFDLSGVTDEADRVGRVALALDNILFVILLALAIGLAAAYFTMPTN